MGQTRVSFFLKKKKTGLHGAVRNRAGGQGPRRFVHHWKEERIDLRIQFAVLNENGSSSCHRPPATILTLRVGQSRALQNAREHA